MTPKSVGLVFYNLGRIGRPKTLCFVFLAASNDDPAYIDEYETVSFLYLENLFLNIYNKIYLLFVPSKKK